MDEDRYIWNAMRRGNEANWILTSQQLPPGGVEVQVFTESGNVQGFINPKHPLAWSVIGKTPHANQVPFSTGYKWRGITGSARQ